MTWPMSVVATAAFAVLVSVPAAHPVAPEVAAGGVTHAVTIARRAPTVASAAPQGTAFGGTPAVGPLFTFAGGRLGQHFCTATVVDSPVRDLVITAAHCVSQMPPGGIAFVPGYHDGISPFGVWVASRVVVDDAWSASADPDHDVAFLVVHQPGTTTRIQDVTGGERLGAGWGTHVPVTVIGYPNLSDLPVRCQGPAEPFGAHQLEFDCGGYPDGTSGGPFLARAGPEPGAGTVIGVIGGYEQGGDLAAVSYSPRFGRAVRALYRTAVAGGG